MNSLHHSRKPGFNEAFFIAKTEENFYSSFNICVTLSKQPTKAQLSQALRRLITHNRWLAYNFFRKRESSSRDYRNDYSLLYVRQIRFDTVVPHCTTLFDVDGEFNSPQYRNDKIHIEDSLNEQFLKLCGIYIPMNLATSPLWRIFIKDKFLIACFNHSIFDGSSGLQFCRDLVSELNMDELSKDVLDVLFDYEVEKDILPPIIAPIEKTFDLYVPSLWERGRMLLLHFFPSLVTNHTEPIEPPIFESVPVKKSMDSYFKVIHFPPKVVDKLVCLSRENGFTLTALFNVIGLRCIEKTIYPHYGKSFSSSHFLAINGRRYYSREPQDPYPYGMMVCGAPMNFPPLSDDLISDCQEFFNLIQYQIESKEGFKKYWAFNYIDFSKVQNDAIGSKKRYTTMVSNIGKVDSPQDEEFKIIDAYFGLTTSTGYHFIFNMVTAESGLNLVIPYLPEYAELKTDDGKLEMDEFAKLFAKTCEQFLAGSKNLSRSFQHRTYGEKI